MATLGRMVATLGWTVAISSSSNSSPLESLKAPSLCLLWLANLRLTSGHLGPDGGHLGPDGGHLGPDGGYLGLDGGHLRLTNDHLGPDAGHLRLSCGHLGQQELVSLGVLESTEPLPPCPPWSP